MSHDDEFEEINRDNPPDNVTYDHEEIHNIFEDLCSRWVELFALKEATAQNCALTLLNEVMLRYGIPRRIHSDNGVQFVSALMQKLTFVLGIRQSFTPVFHLEASPVERKKS